MKIRAIYPGSFDPVTLGHQDIIERASKLFNEVVVAVAGETLSKQFMFTLSERLDFIEQVVAPFSNVSVTDFDGLVTAFAREIESTVLVRGLRAISDYEYEFQMASMNRHLSGKGLETIFMMTAPRYHYLSSSIVKEIGRYGGDISGLVPAAIHAPIRDRLLAHPPG